MATELCLAVHRSQMGQRDIADNLEDDTMSTRLKKRRKPLGIVLPMDEVKRQVIVDALDKCRGDRILAAHLLGIGKTTVYRMARAWRYERPESQATALLTVPSLRRGPPGSSA